MIKKVPVGTFFYGGEARVIKPYALPFVARYLYVLLSALL
jgi:hypothetical protein